MDTSINEIDHRVGAAGKVRSSGMTLCCGSENDCVPITHAFTPKFILDVKDLGSGVVPDIVASLFLMPKIEISNTKGYQDMIQDVVDFKFNMSSSDDLASQVDAFNDLFVTSSWRHRYSSENVDSYFYKKMFSEHNINYNDCVAQLSTNMERLLRSKEMLDLIFNSVKSIAVNTDDDPLVSSYRHVGSIKYFEWSKDLKNMDEAVSQIKDVILDLDNARIYIDVELMFTIPIKYDFAVTPMHLLLKCVVSPLHPRHNLNLHKLRYHIRLLEGDVATYPSLITIPTHGILTATLKDGDMIVPRGNILWDEGPRAVRMPVSWRHNYCKGFRDEKSQTLGGVCYEMCKDVTSLMLKKNEVLLLNCLIQAMSIAINTERTGVSCVILTPFPLRILRSHIENSSHKDIMKFAVSILLGLMETNDLSKYASYYSKIRRINERSMWCLFNSIYFDSTRGKRALIDYKLIQGLSIVNIPVLHGIYRDRMSYSSEMINFAVAVQRSQFALSSAFVFRLMGVSPPSLLDYVDLHLSEIKEVVNKRIEGLEGARRRRVECDFIMLMEYMLNLSGDNKYLGDF